MTENLELIAAAVLGSIAGAALSLYLLGKTVRAAFVQFAIRSQLQSALASGKARTFKTEAEARAYADKLATAKHA